MMDIVGGWLKQIVLLVLIATFFDLLLPNHTMERYVKLVMGLLIILAILNPIFSLLDKDLALSSLTLGPSAGPDGSVTALSAIRREGEALQKTQDRLILSQVQQKLADTIGRDVARRFGVTIQESEVAITEVGADGSPHIRRIRLVIAPQRENGGGDGMPVQPVEPVVIGPAQSASAERDSPPTPARDPVVSRIVDYLQQRWGLTAGQVEVIWEDAS